ncbi:MAG: UvrB/UvrC motif-containing protein, partial [Clostridia bacterium]|nr:UvrB/UvrC motif-containing protein [Clostridia bacterium]
GKKVQDDKKKQKKLSRAEKDKLIVELTNEMHKAARALDFERAAYLRDRIKELRE